MIKNDSDWVKIYILKIFSMNGNIDPLEILKFKVECKFVVSADMNVSIGCAFEYQIAKNIAIK